MMSSGILPLRTISTDNLTSEEIILKAISTLEDRSKNVAAAIRVLKRRLHFLRALEQDISPQEAARLRGLKQFYTHDGDIISGS